MRPASFQEALASTLSGDSPKERTGEVQRGLDFQRLIQGIRDPSVIVYCTWLDSDPSFSDDASMDRNAWSPAKYLAALAAEHEPSLVRWAENTGGGDVAVLDLCRERMQAFGYEGFFYAFESNLYDGHGAEIGDYQAFAAELAPEH
ncbi:hypothetical protein [Cerasicoccus frondis]|uniref:hypothetical protein n=1 Tax=Cerasicoccus frondis TaxID=490090 RepID=UPI00285258B7|nr:hypothetical protein [Cerasicoccus frondis]